MWEKVSASAREPIRVAVALHEGFAHLSFPESADNIDLWFLPGNRPGTAERVRPSNASERDAEPLPENIPDSVRKLLSPLQGDLAAFQVAPGELTAQGEGFFLVVSWLNAESIEQLLS